jgi:hypothetical protein
LNAYKAEVNAICKKGEREWGLRTLKANKKYEGQELKPGEAARIFAVEILLPPLEKMVAEFSKLEPPAEGATKVDHAIDQYKAAVAKGKKNYAELQSGVPLVLARRASEAAGLKDCAA